MYGNGDGRRHAASARERLPPRSVTLPSVNARRLSSLAARAGVPLAAGLVAFALYLATISPTIGVLHDNVDSAELVTVAAVWGVAHPPGSALWIPLGHAALAWLPFVPEPALRTNLLSAALMAGAVALLVVAARRWRPQTAPWAAALAGLLGGLAPLVWAQAIVTEVLALQALLTALALVLAVDAVAGRRWTWFALVLGLLAWNHPTGLALALPLATAALLRARPRRGTVARAAIAFLLPALYTVVYLVLRADAPVAWGHTASAGGLWEHLSGAAYRGVIERSPAAIAAGIPHALRLSLRQIPPPLWPLLPAGALLLARARPLLAAALALAVALLVTFVAAYRASGREDYLAPVVFAAALCAAWGSEALWAWLRPRLPERSTVLALAAGAAGLLVVWAAVSGTQVSLRGHTALRDEARARLAAAAPGATIETARDAETFPLWYARVVLGDRPDVTVRDVRGLAPVIATER